MAERTGYEPGAFCWIDLATPDPDGAKAFYEGLFGWEHEDVPVGDDSVYTLLRLKGRTVCALYRKQAEEAPPAWLSYVSVDDAEASAGYAGQLGGNVISEPFDVMEAGRMAVLADSQGAVFAVWQPGETFGAELVNVPGALTLNQLNTSEAEDAQRFYGELFGWRLEAVGGGEQSAEGIGAQPAEPAASAEGIGAQPAEPAASAYWGIFNGETLNGGMMPLPPEAGPPHWLAYFATADLDASVDTISQLDGQVLVPPTAIPSGRIAVAQDPQGAIFALFEGRLDP